MRAAFFLIFLVILPLVPAYGWFRRRNFGRFRFFLALAAGGLAVPLAGLAQSFFRFPGGPEKLAPVLSGVFIRVSLIEEASRLFTLFLLFRLFPSARIPSPEGRALGAGDTPGSSFFGAPSGLAAGLSFAAGESIFYGLADPGVIFLRAFTALPLHGACGIRAGTALGIRRNEPLRAAFLILAAVFIHGIYDFFIINPGVPWFLPGFIALSALVSSLLALGQNT